MTEIIVPGDPVPWKRARRQGDRYYDEQVNAKNAFAWEVKRKWANPVYRYPFDVAIHLHLRMPKSWSQKKKSKLEGNPATVRPDIDNYIKFVMDALQGTIWVDDAQVIRVTASKVYACEPATHLHINYTLV